MANAEGTRHEAYPSRDHQGKENMEEIERKDASSGDPENDFDKDGDHYGDNSDGKINWTKTQIIAVMSLSALWVGM